MNENNEREQLLNNDDNIRYEINSNIINSFRILKTIYLLFTICVLGVVIIFDNKGYSNNFIYITILYTFIESMTFLTYMYKINNSNQMKKCRILSTLLRLIWIIITYYGIYYWIQENKRNTIFYYITGYIYITNVIYIFFFFFFSCLLCCVRISFIHSENLDQQNRRAAISIIDDVSDIQLFSNILKLDLYNDTLCSICLENFENNDKLRILNCNHYFHNECITTWFDRSSKCPLCNKDMLNNNDGDMV